MSRGFYLNDALAEKRLSGIIELDSPSLIFTSDDDLKYKLPLDQLDITKGGSGNRLIYFSHPNHPNESLYTSDAKILTSSDWRHHPEACQQIHQLGRQKSLAKLLAIGLLLLISLLIYGVYLLKSPMVTAIVHQVPPSWENKLGDLVLSQVSMGKRLISEGEELESFLQVVDPMLKLPALEAHDVKFHLLTDGSINAFALPGGHVVIHTGLIQNADSWDEVMGVIGHELAHLSHRHVLRNMMESAGLFIVIQSFLGDIQGVLAVLLDGGTQLLSLKYSRDFEREADDAGFEYINQAGFDPQGMVSFFNKIKAEQEQNELGSLMNEHLSIMSTHPATHERIQEMELRIAEDSTLKKIIPQRPEFMSWRQQILLLNPKSSEHDSVPTSASEPHEE